MRLTSLGIGLAALVVSACATLDRDERDDGFRTAEAASAGRAVVDRGRFVVEVEGQGDDVILVPGLASSRAVWDRIAPSLAAGHRVHRVHLAGFAGVPAAENATGPIVSPVVEALNRYISDAHMTRPAVIGHSMGGLLGLLLAQEHPESVGRLLVIDAGAFYGALFDPNATSASMEPIAQEFQRQLEAMTDEQFASTIEETTAQLVRTKADRPTVAGWSLASDRRVMGRALFDVMTTDARPALAAMTTPVTVLYAWDEAMPASSGETDATFARVYEGLPGLRLVRVDASYHFIMLDQPKRFAREVAMFLAPASGWSRMSQSR